MQKTAAQMQSIKRAVEETAMFSASIIAKVKSKIKRSRAVSKSLPQPRPAVQMTNTEALAVLRALHGEPMIIRAKCSFRKKHQLFEKIGTT